MATLAIDLPKVELEAPKVSAGDRLGMTLFCAIVAHAIVILGVVFVPNDRPEALYNTLDIVLVQKKTEAQPEDAELLAQANQEGGGESPEKERPATPLPAPLTSDTAQVAAAAPPQETAPPAQEETTEIETQAPVAETVEQKPVLVAQNAKNTVDNVSRISPQPRRKPTPPAPTAVADASDATPNLNAADLITRSLAMASLSAEIDQRLAAYSERPRRKWVSAKTREYKYAAYMEAWRIKVERIGNLNYPDEARRNKLSGHLLLEVALNADGSINDIVLRRSSGQRVLDDAAIRIVKLAAPFAPLPKGILEETDILHIERTWRFMTGARFASQ